MRLKEQLKNLGVFMAVEREPNGTANTAIIAIVAIAIVAALLYFLLNRDERAATNTRETQIERRTDTVRDRNNGIDRSSTTPSNRNGEIRR